MDVSVSVIINVYIILYVYVYIVFSPNQVHTYSIQLKTSQNLWRADFFTTESNVTEIALELVATNVQTRNISHNSKQATIVMGKFPLTDVLKWIPNLVCLFFIKSNICSH